MIGRDQIDDRKGLRISLLKCGQLKAEVGCSWALVNSFSRQWTTLKEMLCHNSKYHLYPLPARSIKESPCSPHIASILCRNETQTFWRSEEGPHYSRVPGGFSLAGFQVRYLSSYSTGVPTQALLPAEALIQHTVSLCTWAVTLVGFPTGLSHIQKTY